MKEGQKYLIKVVTDTYIVHNSCALFCGYTFGMIHNHTAVTGISSEGFFKKMETPATGHTTFTRSMEREMSFCAALRLYWLAWGSGAIDSNADVVHPHQCRNSGCLLFFSFFFLSFLFCLLAFHFIFFFWSYQLNGSHIGKRDDEGFCDEGGVNLIYFTLAKMKEGS